MKDGIAWSGHYIPTHNIPVKTLRDAASQVILSLAHTAQKTKYEIQYSKKRFEGAPKPLSLNAILNTDFTLKK